MKKEIIIVGGGTAGWLTALYVKKMYGIEANITLVESEDIGIVGVGEGSVPSFFNMLSLLDIDFNDFVRSTNATHKLGISFENWNGDGKKYFHGFDSMHKDINYHNTGKEFIANEYIGYIMKNNYDFNDSLLNAKLTYSNTSPIMKTQINGVSTSTLSSFHFDAYMVGKYFRKIAERRKVKRIEGVVTDFITDDSGNIKSIKLKDGQLIKKIDFVFDCTGFNRLVIGKKYNTEWKSYKDHLRVSAAIPFNIPQSKEAIQPCTKAIAMKYGWMWQIPLQNRWGCGYTFDEAYINSEEAKAEVEELLGYKIENNRTIKIDAGRYEKVWVNNCIAIGLSAGFTEPVEATSIYITLSLLQMLNKFHIDNPNEHVVGMYNKKFAEMADDIMDFLQFHYFTKRNDSQFWREFKDKTKISDRLAKKLKKWKTKAPEIDDFNLEYFGDYTFFGYHNWISVGIGIDYFNKDIFIHKYNNYNNKANIVKHFDKIQTNMNMIVSHSISEIDFIKLCKLNLV
jgi:tryptophan halogenase